MLRVIGVLSLVLLLSSAVTAADKSAAPGVFKCDYVARRSHSSGDASVTWRDGAIQKITFDNFFEGAAGVPGCPCSLKVVRGEPTSIWKDQAGQTEIELNPPREKTGERFLHVTTSADGFLLDLSKASSYYCGACADLPQQVTVPKSGKRCEVKQ